MVSLLVYFFKIGKKEKKIIYNINSSLLILNKIKENNNLKILFNNNKIENLYNSTIIFKNIGNDIIEPNDITSSDPIIISTGNKFFLDDNDNIQIVASNAKTKVTYTKINDSTIELIFDLLPPKSSITITLLHDGIISCTGSLKTTSIDEIKNQEYFITKDPKLKSNEIITNAIFFLLIVVSCCEMSISSVVNQGKIKYQYIDDSFIILIILALIAVMLLTLIYLLKNKNES